MFSNLELVIRAYIRLGTEFVSYEDLINESELDCGELFTVLRKMHEYDENSVEFDAKVNVKIKLAS